MLFRLFILLGLLIQFNWAKANTIEITPDFQSLIIENDVVYSRDFKKEPYFDYSYIKSLSFSEKGMVPKDIKGAFWIKITIKNTLNKRADLSIETNRFENLELFFFKENHILNSVKAGINHPFSERDFFKGDISILPFSIPTNSTKDVYLWVSQPEKWPYQYSTLPFTLKSRVKSVNDLNTSENVLYFFLGAIILMTLYNLALFMVVRKPDYIYYIINNVFIILFVLAQVGKLDYYLFDTPKYHEKTILILGNLSFIFYMLFSKEVLKFKKYDPPANRIVNYALLIWPTLLTFVIFNKDKIAVALGSIGAIVGYGVIIFSCVKAIRNGSVSIKYFFIGNLFYLSAVTIQILQINGVLPYKIGPFTAIEFVEIGTMLQLALFSLTLGSSINIIKRKLLEKEVEQQRQKHDEQIKIAQVIQNKNIELERKVHIRTMELKTNSDLLKQRNQDINDSLNYARRLQNAFLPELDVWQKLLPSSFLIYQPKEVISGDFFWATEKNNKKFFAIADCTGHGVPGAMVSLIGINNLQRCTNEFLLEKPSEILDQLRDLIEESFEGKFNREEIKDGMDIALCSLYEENGTKYVEFAGANNPFWLFRGSDTPIEGSKKSKELYDGLFLHEISGDKQPIGKYHTKTNFTNHKIKVEKGDEIYLFTDGYVDQFGGADNKKFKMKNFRKLLGNSYGLDPTEKKNIILNTFRRWKDKEEQVDDVCLTGIKI